MRDLLARSWKGLWDFGGVAEELWYDALVYSDSTPDQTAQDLSPTDRGMWWPCLAIWDGRRFRTWCQDFALNGSRKTWDTSPNGRIHIYKRRNQPTPWQQFATAPSSGAASSSAPPPAKPPPPRPPPPPPPTASSSKAPSPPRPVQAKFKAMPCPTTGRYAYVAVPPAAEVRPEPDYVWESSVVIEELSDTDEDSSAVIHSESDSDEW